MRGSLFVLRRNFQLCISISLENLLKNRRMNSLERKYKMVPEKKKVYFALRRLCMVNIKKKIFCSGHRFFFFSSTDETATATCEQRTIAHLRCTIIIKTYIKVRRSKSRTRTSFGFDVASPFCCRCGSEFHLKKFPDFRKKTAAF